LSFGRPFMPASSNGFPPTTLPPFAGLVCQPFLDACWNIRYSWIPGFVCAFQFTPMWFHLESPPVPGLAGRFPGRIFPSCRAGGLIIVYLGFFVFLPPACSVFTSLPFPPEYGSFLGAVECFWDLARLLPLVSFPSAPLPHWLLFISSFNSSFFATIA